MNNKEDRDRFDDLKQLLALYERLYNDPHGSLYNDQIVERLIVRTIAEMHEVKARDKE